MRPGTIIAAILLAIIFVAFGYWFFTVIAPQGKELYEGLGSRNMELTSTAFSDGGRIPDKYTCNGEDISPQLSWSGYPDGTKSFVIIMEDPDAPGGIFTHWVMWNIPASVNSLSEGVPEKGRLDSGAVQSKNDFGKIGYGGPCPPEGSQHRYIFRVFALDTTIDTQASTKADVLNAMRWHVLGRGELTGIFSR